MTTEQRKRFTVISNNEFNHTNEEAGKKFGIEDLLKW